MPVTSQEMSKPQMLLSGSSTSMCWSIGKVPTSGGAACPTAGTDTTASAASDDTMPTRLG
ncbi:hypothetical protein ACI78U_00850 [Geodermatophilus sp. SYSU D00710]